MIVVNATPGQDPLTKEEILAYISAYEEDIKEKEAQLSITRNFLVGWKKALKSVQDREREERTTTRREKWLDTVQDILRKETDVKHRYLMRDNHTFAKLSNNNRVAFDQIYTEQLIRRYSTLFQRDGEKEKDTYSLQAQPWEKIKDSVAMWLSRTRPAAVEAPDDLAIVEMKKWLESIYKDKENFTVDNKRLLKFKVGAIDSFLPLAKNNTLAEKQTKYEILTRNFDYKVSFALTNNALSWVSFTSNTWDDIKENVSLFLEGKPLKAHAGQIFVYRDPTTSFINATLVELKGL